MRALGLMDAERQRFGSLLMHTPHGDARYELPWTFSTFDYRQMCELLWRDCDATFETAKVNGRAAFEDDGAVRIETDRGTVSAPLVVDALGWRRVLARGDGYQPPDAPLSRGLEVHPAGRGEDLEIWIDRRYVPAGYGWSFPAEDELRIGIGSFDPRFHVKDTTVLLTEDLGKEPNEYQGNWIPHKLRRATEGGDLLRRRLGRPLPAAHRRGDPHRPLLRDRARPRAARRRRGPAEPRGGRRAPTPSSTTRTSGSSAGCCGFRG